MSEVKVNKITPTADCGTVTLGDSGDAITIPSGVTLTSGGAITNSGTITNTGTISGGTITGTIDGQVNWQTTVKTTAFTATAGEGYFCNTTSAAFTVTLPASPSAGDIVGIKDYANTADTNNITIGRNGSNIQGTANDFVVNTEGLSIVLLYVDSTKGWLSIGQAKASDISEEPLFTIATGGTITTSGDYKIHTFTGPGTFCVSQTGNDIPTGGPSNVDYLVIAGGGGGGGPASGGGGGAGGYRESSGTDSGCYSRSPLGACVSALPISVQGYPITIGAGGIGGTPSNPAPLGPRSQPGSNSIFSTITSTGGGAGAISPGPSKDGKPGGSGGGGGQHDGTPSGGSGGSGNTPPVSPPQGSNGGNGGPGPSSNPRTSGGGGGATGAGETGPGGDGGAGATSTINGSPVTRAGGGGGGAEGLSRTGSPGPGGGGASNPGSAGQNGTDNKGGGGGGSNRGPTSNNYAGGNGGSGIVIIRYKYQ